MKLFSGSANKRLAEKVAKELGIELSPVETHVFPDGEKRIRITESIVDEICVIIQSASTPVDQNYMELFFIVDALKRNGARKVVAVVPYFGYQRQDHVFRDGEAVSLEVVIKMIESVGVDHFVSFDLHSVKIPELFTIPVSHISALPTFAKKLRKMNGSLKETILVSPDKGGLRGIKIFSELLGGTPFIVLNKKRDTLTGVVTYEELDSNSIAGRNRAIILDDMISSGSTIMPVAEMLTKHGIEEIDVFATHAVFSENAPYILQNSPVSTVCISDTVRVSTTKRFEKLQIVSIAEEIGKALNSISAS
ncbi:MAG TPA: ribose-phosphate pyrophosphokinase [Candidatus Saccharimonadales bacterium]|nr:ribose-phosphate pyrophosphokinase [Candidatus Saccharimonadales bacterium]